MITNSFYKGVKRVSNSENRVESNLKLVIAVANKYSVFADINDLISEGTIGLCFADRNYKSDKCDSFIPYAKLCIETYIRNYLRDMNNTVKVGQLDQKEGSRCYSESLFYNDEEGNEILRKDVISAVDTDEIKSDEEVKFYAFNKAISELPVLNQKVIKMRLKLDEYSDIEDNSLGFISSETGISRYKLNQLIDSTVVTLREKINASIEF